MSLASAIAGWVVVAGGVVSEIPCSTSPFLSDLARRRRSARNLSIMLPRLGMFVVKYWCVLTVSEGEWHATKARLRLIHRAMVKGRYYRSWKERGKEKRNGKSSRARDEIGKEKSRTCSSMRHPVVACGAYHEGLGQGLATDLGCSERCVAVLQLAFAR